jgi:magnesium transporter
MWRVVLPRSRFVPERSEPCFVLRARPEGALIEITLYRQDGGFQERVPVQEIDQLLLDEACLLWIDVTSPTPEELRRLQEELKLHPLVVEDLTDRNERPRIRTFEGGYVMIFYAVRLGEQEERLRCQQINLVVARHYLLTVHTEPIEEIAEVIRRWRENTAAMPPDVNIPLYSLLDTLVDGYFPCIDQIAERVEAMEDQIFQGLSRDALEAIFALKKDMLNLRRVVAPERDVINVLLRGDQGIFSPGALVYFQDLYDHLIRVIDSIDTYRDLLSSAMETYLSVTSNRLAENSIEMARSANQLNATMRILTSWSIILMSGALIAGIYGMNFEHMPELHWRYGYYAALGLILLVGGALVAYFRRRDWL